MTAYDSIVVGNDFVSEHWLAEQFPAAVRTLRAGWKEREEHTKTTPRSGLVALATTFGRDLVRAREEPADVSRLRELHAQLREALQLPGEESPWAGERAGQELTVPAVVPRSPNGTHLLVLQAQDAATVEDVIDSEGAGRLLTPAKIENADEPRTAKVISEVFG
jgi:hypothetical protein